MIEFNKKIMRYGRICQNGHEHLPGQSMRYRRGGECVQCKASRNRSRPKPMRRSLGIRDFLIDDDDDLMEHHYDYGLKGLMADIEAGKYSGKWNGANGR